MPASVIVSVPAGFADSVVPAGSGLLAAVTEACGRLLETVIGRPTTVVLQDFAIGDTVLLVETTIGMPDAGAVWVGDYLVTYTSKTAGSLVGCTSRPRAKILGAGLSVTLHLPSAPPA
jgi:hypothetical protein